jgi:xanthosine phosphorylase
MKAKLSIANAVNYIKEHSENFKPKVGIILGSGSGGITEELKNVKKIPYENIPGFVKPSVAGHQGILWLGELQGTPVACLQGRVHFYEGHSGDTAKILVRTLKKLGCETLVVTNAAASLRAEVTPGNLVAISDHINLQFTNPLIGENDEDFGPRFPAMDNAYDKTLREKLMATAKKLAIPIHQGTYIGVIGPSYETPAEINAFRIWGADVVGMSTVPEVIIARHCGMKVVAISVVTNLACGLAQEKITHDEVLLVAKNVMQNLTKLIATFVGELNEH